MKSTASSNKKNETFKKNSGDNNKDVKTANTYSVISMCQTNTNIVAICLFR